GLVAIEEKKVDAIEIRWQATGLGGGDGVEGELETALLPTEHEIGNELGRQIAIGEYRGSSREERSRAFEIRARQEIENFHIGETEGEPAVRTDDGHIFGG